MEYLNLYDDERNLTDEIMCRGDKVPDNRNFLLTGIFIENSKGELLMQYTSPEKNSVWAVTGGHVGLGEDTLTAIKREVLEEIGLDISNDNIDLIISKKHGHTFFDLYYVYKDIDIDNLVLQESEVERVKWCTIDELYAFNLEGTLRKSNIEMLEDYLKYKNKK